MAWSVVQSASTAATGTISQTISATFATANVTAGNKIIAVYGNANGGFSPSSVTASITGGSTMTQCGSISNTTDFVDLYLFALDVPAGVAGTKPTVTVTAAGQSSDTPSLVILEVSGLAAGNTTAAMLDGTAVTAAFAAAASDAQPAYSSTAAGEFLVACEADDGGPQTVTPPSGYTLNASSVTDNSFADAAIAYKNSTGGAETGTWTFGGTTTGTALLVVAFKVAAGGGPPASAQAVLSAPYRPPAVAGRPAPRVITGTGPAGPVNVSDSDAGQGADAGEALSAALADSDAGHSTEGQNSPGGSASDSDTGHGADGGESVAASLADADAGHGTDAGESVAVAGTATARAVLSAPYQPEPVTWAASPVLLTGPQAFNDSDVGHGADAGEAVHASLSDSDAGHGTDAGESGTGNVQKSDSDAGRGQDSGFAFISGSDAGHGADAEAPFTFAGSDAGQGAEAEWSRWPHDAEAGTGAEAQHWSGPLKDTAEAGHGADAGEAMAVADAGAFPAGDSCLSSDTPNPVVDIFTYVPTWDIGQGGGLLRIVWTNPETGQRHVVIQSSRPDGNMLRAARELAAAREVAFPGDSDACRAADEEDGGILAVTGPAAAPALEVTAEVTW